MATSSRQEDERASAFAKKKGRKSFGCCLIKGRDTRGGGGGRGGGDGKRRAERVRERDGGKGAKKENHLNNNINSNNLTSKK